MHYVYIREQHFITLLHYYMFQPLRGQPQEVLVHFASRVNTMHVRCKYQIKQQCVVCFVAVAHHKVGVNQGLKVLSLLARYM
jgi:hypothetical protein